MEKVELEARVREVLGKKVSRLRRLGITPARLYGPGTKPIPLELETAALLHALARMRRHSTISLSINGDPNPREVVIRRVQKDPRSGQVLHVDFFQAY